jgi:serine/threonine protein phosphatase PrpC
MEREPAIVASDKIVERLKKAEAKKQIEKNKEKPQEAAAEET